MSAAVSPFTQQRPNATCLDCRHPLSFTPPWKSGAGFRAFECRLVVGDKREACGCQHDWIDRLN